MCGAWLAEIANMHNDIQDFLRAPGHGKVPAESDRRYPAGASAPAGPAEPQNVRH
jgi:hypothetical protein